MKNVVTHAYSPALVAVIPCAMTAILRVSVAVTVAAEIVLKIKLVANAKVISARVVRLLAAYAIKYSANLVEITNAQIVEFPCAILVLLNTSVCLQESSPRLKARSNKEKKNGENRRISKT
ncbi:hypothetical protein LCGC14_0220730 [marine sediment metagenome]|uniref:Uncharacterized protein n=1 Tax=marine sediment metagenome TaxID=412755 RepID=A0A0F9UDE2_9ZZZZ